MYLSVDFESSGSFSLRNKSKRDAKSSSPAPIGKTMSEGCIPAKATKPLPAIEIIDEERFGKRPSVLFFGGLKFCLVVSWVHCREVRVHYMEVSG